MPQRAWLAGAEIALVCDKPKHGECNASTLSDWAESESRRADALERERDSLKAQLAGAAVCKRCMVTAFPDCPSCGGLGVKIPNE